ELIQNADDRGASEFEIELTAGHILFTHNGSRAFLDHVAPIVMPYLTTKEGESDTIGRFGIGLKTLSAIGSVMTVRCFQYHFQIDYEGPHYLPMVDGDVDGTRT